jgi:pimeloyl-ACP methyl ester carboxylesterase
VNVYSDLSAGLTARGYTVVRYEFFNHGWSVSDDPYLKITDEVMVEQVEDLLDHASLPGDAPPNFVGHSTGGLVSIMCAHRLSSKRPIGRLALVSPALWASKPLIAQLADHVPSAMYSLLVSPLTGPLIKRAVADAYLKNCDVAFAQAEDGSYRFPAAHRAAVAFNRRLFESHPRAHSGIATVNSYVLREDLLAGWRAELAAITAAEFEGGAVPVTLVFGSQDNAVPFTKERLAWLRSRGVRVVELGGQGHESLYVLFGSLPPVPSLTLLSSSSLDRLEDSSVIIQACLESFS